MHNIYVILIYRYVEWDVTLGQYTESCNIMYAWVIMNRNIFTKPMGTIWAMQNVKYITIIYQLHSFNSMRYFLQSVETMPINNIFSGLTITFPLQSGASFFFPMASWIWSKHLSWVWIFPNEINTCHDFENFTVGSPVTSDQALLQIFGHGNVFKTARLYKSDLFRPLTQAQLGLIRGYYRPNKEQFHLVTLD